MPKWVNVNDAVPDVHGQIFSKINGRKCLLSADELEKYVGYYDDAFWLDDSDWLEEKKRKLDGVTSIHEFSVIQAKENVPIKRDKQAQLHRAFREYYLKEIKDLQDQIRMLKVVLANPNKDMAEKRSGCQPMAKQVQQSQQSTPIIDDLLARITAINENPFFDLQEK